MVASPTGNGKSSLTLACACGEAFGKGGSLGGNGGSLVNGGSLGDDGSLGNGGSPVDIGFSLVVGTLSLEKCFLKIGIAFLML